MPSNRRAAFIALAALGSLAAIELATFALLSLSHGRPYGHRDLALRRTAAGRDPDPAAVGPQPLPEPFRDPRWAEMLGQEVVHPFLGYVPDRDAGSRLGADPEAVELGFPFNDRELPRQPVPGEVVVGVFGGSVAASLAGEGRDRLERALEEVPRFAGRQVRVRAFAYGGYKQPQQLMALGYLLALGVHLDVAINVDGYNEAVLSVEENVKHGVAAIFPRGWALRVGALDAGTRRALGTLTVLGERRRDWARRAAQAPWRYSLAAGALWLVYDRHLQAEMARWIPRAETAAEDDYQARGPRLEAPSWDAVYDGVAALWRRSSLHMARLCAANGIEYHHFLQPNQYVDGSKPLSAAERRTAWQRHSPMRRTVGQLYPRFLRAGAALERDGVSFTPLVDLYRDVEATIYIDACCHVNRLGNDLMAARIAARIAERLVERPL